MKHQRLTGILLGALLCTLLVGMLALTGCEGKGTLSSEFVEETNAYKVTADDAGKGSAVMASGGFYVKEGQVVIVSPDFKKGSLQVRLLNAANDVVIDEKASGHELSAHEVAPGEYAIGARCDENGATGTVLVVAVDAAEFEKQNQDLEAALAAAAKDAKSASAAA